MILLLLSYDIIFSSTFQDYWPEVCDAKKRINPRKDFVARLNLLCSEVHFTMTGQHRMPPCIFWRSAIDF